MYTQLKPTNAVFCSFGCKAGVYICRAQNTHSHTSTKYYYYIIFCLLLSTPLLALEFRIASSTWPSVQYILRFLFGLLYPRYHPHQNMASMRRVSYQIYSTLENTRHPTIIVLYMLKRIRKFLHFAARSHREAPIQSNKFVS